MFVNRPAIFRIPVDVSVSVAPGLTVKLLEVTLLFIEGIRMADAGIVTFVDEVGTAPAHQLPAVAQSVLMFPVHCPAAVVPARLV